MIEIHFRSFPRGTVVWFADEAELPSGISRLTSYELRFKQARQKPPNDGLRNYSEVVHYETLLTDLTADPGRLWSAISPTTRNNINAATAKLAYEVTYFDGDPQLLVTNFLPISAPREASGHLRRRITRSTWRTAQLPALCSTERWRSCTSTFTIHRGEECTFCGQRDP
jgi:hypothetical protein